MRKSLQDIAFMVRDIPYPGTIPEELAHLHCYISDSGHCILAIPEPLIAEMIEEPYMYEVAMPVKYVLKAGWRPLYGTDSIVVPVGYDPAIGALVPAGYDEF